MKFLKTYGVVLVLSEIFVFFGGWQLFEFVKRPYLTTAVLAVILSAVIFVFIAQAEKIERLEKRLKELEEQNHS